MNKKKFQKIYFLFFKTLIFLALIISIINKFWINVLVIISILTLLYLPEFLGKTIRNKFPSRIEILLLSLLYFFIFLESSQIIDIYNFGIRILFHLMLSSIIALIGFYMIYIINKEKMENLNLNSLTLAIFAFCFSLTLGAIWQIIRFLFDYLFNISIQNYTSSDALGFLTIHFLGAFLVSIAGYFYLEPKNNLMIKIKEYISYFVGDKIGLVEKKEKNIEKELLKLIKSGESKNLEFKSTLRTNLHTNEHDKNIEFSILKTINAFLNTSGGVLLVGVGDLGEIVGIEKDKFKSEDKLYLHFTNLIKTTLGSNLASLLDYRVIPIKGKKIFKIDVKISKKPIFIKNNTQEDFYIRSGPSSVPLSGSKLLTYINENF